MESTRKSEIRPQQNFCVQKPSHETEKIKYLCMEPSCSLHRILCRQCLHQNHRKHRVGVIDKLIEPLCRLSMNAGTQTSASDYKHFTDRLNDICEEWQKLSEVIARHANELTEGIIFQLTAVLNTFKSEEVDEAYDVLMNNQSKVEEINKVVDSMNFLNKDFMQDVESVKNFTDYIAERAKKSMSKTFRKIDLLLKKMQSHIKELDFNNFEDFKKGYAEEEGQKSSEKMDPNRQEEEDEEETTPTPTPSKKGSVTRKVKTKFESSDLGGRKQTPGSDSDTSNTNSRKMELSNFVRRMGKQR